MSSYFCLSTEGGKNGTALAPLAPAHTAATLGASTWTWGDLLGWVMCIHEMLCIIFLCGGKIVHFLHITATQSRGLLNKK